MNIGDEPMLVFEQQGEQRNIIHDMYYQLFIDQVEL